eukprot:403372267
MMQEEEKEPFELNCDQKQKIHICDKGLESLSVKDIQDLALQLELFCAKDCDLQVELINKILKALSIGNDLQCEFINSLISDERNLQKQPLLLKLIIKRLKQMKHLDSQYQGIDYNLALYFTDIFLQKLLAFPNKLIEYFPFVVKVSQFAHLYTDTTQSLLIGVLNYVLSFMRFYVNKFDDSSLDIALIGFTQNTQCDMNQTHNQQGNLKMIIFKNFDYITQLLYFAAVYLVEMVDQNQVVIKFIGELFEHFPFMSDLQSRNVGLFVVAFIDFWQEYIKTEFSDNSKMQQLKQNQDQLNNFILDFWKSFIYPYQEMLCDVETSDIYFNLNDTVKSILFLNMNFLMTHRDLIFQNFLPSKDDFRMIFIDGFFPVYDQILSNIQKEKLQNHDGVEKCNNLEQLAVCFINSFNIKSRQGRSKNKEILVNTVSKSISKMLEELKNSEVEKYSLDNMASQKSQMDEVQVNTNLSERKSSQESQEEILYPIIEEDSMDDSNDQNLNEHSQESVLITNIIKNAQPQNSLMIQSAKSSQAPSFNSSRNKIFNVEKVQKDSNFIDLTDLSSHSVEQIDHSQFMKSQNQVINGNCRSPDILNQSELSVPVQTVSLSPDQNIMREQNGTLDEGLDFTNYGKEQLQKIYKFKALLMKLIDFKNDDLRGKTRKPK